MPLEITHSDREGIDVLELKGDLVIGPEDTKLRDELDQLAAAGKVRVALNLREVHKLDTTALGTLISEVSKLRKAGGNLTVFNLNPAHIALVTQAHLTAVFEVCQDEQEAINTFFPDRAINRYDILSFVESKQKPEQ